MFEQFDKWADKAGKKREAYDVIWDMHKRLKEAQQFRDSLQSALKLARQQVVKMVEVNNKLIRENEYLVNDLAFAEKIIEDIKGE